MSTRYLKFAYITGSVMAVYITIVVLVMLGINQPVIVYPLGFLAAYVLNFNLKERFKGREDERSGTILLLAIVFLVVAILFALGPALILLL